MKENSYQKLMSEIHTPAGLNDRVLFAARQRAAERNAEQVTAPKRLAPRKRHPAVLRTAVCAACALALVAGTFTLRPVEEGGMPVPQYEFALTACAAEETYAPGANGGLAFVVGQGMTDPEYGAFTGCLFQVTGEGIEKLTLSVDRGGLYRYELHTDMTEDEIAAARKAMDEGALVPAAISQSDDGTWYMPEMTALSGTVTEDYAPEVSYGFWVPPTEVVSEEPHANIDRFDGASLVVTAAFTDGTKQSHTYDLSSGQLKIVREADGTMTILPQLAGDKAADLFGIYAVSESDSRWLSWPVQGANTVSLSAPYGKAPNGNIHNGIDIPAAEGTPILAAADGTVLEVGFDATRGNYLRLDHGDGLTTLYGQCRNVDVAEGGTVKAGEMLGAVGTTGMATGPHLHFEVCRGEKPENPVAYFDAATRATLRAE